MKRTRSKRKWEIVDKVERGDFTVNISGPCPMTVRRMNLMSEEQLEKGVVEVCILGVTPIWLSRYPNLSEVVDRLKKIKHRRHDMLREFQGSVYHDVGETLLSLPSAHIKHALMSVAVCVEDLPSKAMMTRSILVSRPGGGQ